MKPKAVCSIFRVALIASLSARIATAATPVTSWDYYTATGSGDSSWVSPANTTSVLAVDWGTGGMGTVVNWGGVNWAGSNAGESKNQVGTVQTVYHYPNVAWGSTYGDNTFYPTSSFPLLGSGVTGSDNHIADINGLTGGKVYKVQFVLADSRTLSFPDIGRTVTISGANGTTGTSSNYQYGHTDGSYAVVTANIIADVNGWATFKPSGLNSYGSIGQQMNAMQVLAVGTDLSWTAGDGTWSNVDANWTGPAAWTDPLNNAIFNNTGSATAVTVSGTQTVGAVYVGNGSNNATYTFSGGTLNAASFTVQGNGANDPGLGNATLNNLTLNTDGNLAVGRWDLVIGGSSTVNIDGQLRSTSNGSGNGDWGRVTIQNSANVTATGGVNSGGAVFGLTLNGGTLTTPSIRASELSYASGARVVFNGTTVVPTQDNSNFLTVDISNRAYVGNNGALFNTNGKNITISTNLNNLSGHNGTIVKSGAGTLSLWAGSGDNWANAYYQNLSGGMTITGGTVELTSQFIRMGSITIENGGTLRATQPWATGASNPWFDGRSVGSITVNAGGTLEATQIANSIMEGLTLNGGAVTSPLGTSGDLGHFVIASQVTAGGNTTSTISAELAVTGAQTFSVGSGSTLNISGVVHDRHGAAPAGITKAGSGTLVLSGNNYFTGAVTVNEGLVIVQNGNGISDGSGVTLNNASQLRLDANESVGSLAGSATSSVNMQGNTLQIGNQNGSATAQYDGVISGSGGIVRRGSGTQTLTGNNSFSGSVTVRDSGTLSVPNVAASGNQPLGTGTGHINLDAGATLAITGSGEYALPATRGLVLGGTTGGILEISAGTLNMAGGITNDGGIDHFTKTGAGTFNFSGSGSWNGNLTVSAGTFNLTVGGSISGVGATTVGGTLNINSSTSMKTSSLDILSGGAVNLDAGTLRVGGGGLGLTGRSIDNDGGNFTWGSATLSVYTTGSGEAGLTDRTATGGSPSGPAVMEGNYLSVAGDLNASAGSNLDLGSTYLSNGLRYNQLNVSGNLTLNAGSLSIGLSPYFLRPSSANSVATGDWGTIVLVYAEDTLSGTFNQIAGKTVIAGIGQDAIGWTQLADIEYTGGGSPFDPASLGLNQWLIEYRDGSGGNGFNFTQSPGGAVLLHYRVAGSVPEPASAGLLVAGALLLRALRRRVN